MIAGAGHRVSQIPHPASSARVRFRFQRRIWSRHVLAPKRYRDVPQPLSAPSWHRRTFNLLLSEGFKRLFPESPENPDAKEGTVMVALRKQEFEVREDTPHVAKPRASRITPKEIYGFLRERQPDILARLAE